MLSSSLFDSPHFIQNKIARRIIRRFKIYLPCLAYMRFASQSRSEIAVTIWLKSPWDERAKNLQVSAVQLSEVSTAPPVLWGRVNSAIRTVRLETGSRLRNPRFAFLTKSPEALLIPAIYKRNVSRTRSLFRTA